MLPSNRAVSDTEAPASIRVIADNPALEIRLLDTDADVQAHGVGGLIQQVPPGLYELQYRAGSAITSELISLRPGEELMRSARVDFASAAPISSARYASETERVALDQLTSVPPVEVPGTVIGELVVFLRQVTEATPDFTLDSFIPLELVDEEGNIISNLEGDEVRFDTQGRQWAAACLKLAPGGYALRLDPSLKPVTEPAVEPGRQWRAFDQSIWIENGWQTIVFVPTAACGPAPQIASIHMTRIGERWDPSSPSTLVTETLLSCLRSGRGLASGAYLDLVVSEQTTNPMLAIVAAHSALVANPPDFELFDGIIEHLVAKWPEFPDVRALYPIGEERRRYYQLQEQLDLGKFEGDSKPPAPPTQSVSWPPMLLQSYQGLIRCDAKWPDLELIEENSLAERAATRLLIGGLWSAWEPFDRETVSDQLLRSSVLDDPPHTLGDALDRVITSTLRLLHQKVTAREWRQAIAGWTPKDPTTIRLKQFLSLMVDQTDAASVQDFVRGLDPRAISQATGLPAGIVRSFLGLVQKRFENV